eukprot:3732559-Rhodomonas_salina.1
MSEGGTPEGLTQSPKRMPEDSEISSGRVKISSPLPGSVHQHTNNDLDGHEQIFRPQSASFVHTSPSRQSSAPLFHQHDSEQGQLARPQTAHFDSSTRTRIYSANRRSRPRRDLTWNDFTDMDEVPARKSVGDTAHTDSVTESEKEGVGAVIESGVALAKVIENVTPEITPPTSERRDREDLRRFKGAYHVRKVQRFKKNAPITVLHTRARKSTESGERENANHRATFSIDTPGEKSPDSMLRAFSPGMRSNRAASSVNGEQHAILRLTVTEATDLPGT